MERRANTWRPITIALSLVKWERCCAVRGFIPRILPHGGGSVTKASSRVDTPKREGAKKPR